MKCLLKEHEGLDFLKDHPDFQIKYSESVAMRIFYYNDSNMDGRLSIREFYQSNILTTINKVCDEKDINLIRDYFSYEHFYVLYCKFWELDSNEHTFLIDKEGFSKYDSHCLNTKAIERIFQQIPRSFSSLVKDKMNFEDFLWYILSEEDKQSFTSITYWFRVMDIDSDGLLSPIDIKYFYDEQLARLEYSSNDTIPLSDILQQVYDMLNIDNRYSISLYDLLSKRQQASIFFNIFLNLNKFLSYEQRDPFQYKSEIDKYPGYSNWDLFALYEYSRISDDREDDDGLLEEVEEVEINN
jgi:serine/threonine-protein phosphatase 2A regulatory subunit B''